ncbi:MAG: ATP-binding protein [Candidatus Odinarchaeota archaeon]
MVMERNYKSTFGLKYVPHSDIEEELSFDELGGISKQIKILKDYSLFIKKTINSEKAHCIKGRLMFIGPPGTGKTASAYAFSKYVKWDFLELDISSIISEYLGETPKSITSVFNKAAEIAKERKKEGEGVILFLDEFDSIGSKRESSQEHKEIARAVNALLVELEKKSFGRTGLFIICATNLHFELDRALKRRFDTIIEFGMPDYHDRVEIISKLLKHQNLHSPLISAESIAEKTEKFSPSDLTALINRGVFYSVIDSGIELTTKLFIDIIESNLVQASNTDFENNHKERANISQIGSDISFNSNHTENPSWGYLELLRHAIVSNQQGFDDYIQALELFETIPFEIRSELYFYSNGRIFGEKNPSKLLKNQIDSSF